MDGLAPRAPHFLSPRGVSRGVSQLSKRGFLATLETTEKDWHPSPFFVTPSASEGSLGACAPREDRKGLAPRAQARGPSALACLEKTSQGVVPSEVRDASLSLGKTKEGLLGKTKERTLGRTKKKGLFEQSPFLLEFCLENTKLREIRRGGS
jgi:hypothetical protein